MKRFLKILLSSVLLITTILMVVIFGFRYWLKTNLPQYIKEKTPYNITYKNLEFRFLEGDMTASQVRISNKQSGNQDMLGLNGTIDEVYISNLGIYDALINKTLNSNEIKLNEPNLKITLAKPTEKKILKKKASIVFKNVKISNGNVEIERHNHSPFFKMKNLSLSVDNLNFAEEDAVRKLPFTFDSYTVKGNDLEYFPSEVYKITTKSIDTKEGQMLVKDFSLFPQIDEHHFKIKYPHQTFFHFNALEMNFKDISLKNNKISIKNVTFSEPKMTMQSNQLKKKEKKNAFIYDLDFENINFKNAQFNLLDSKGKEKLLVKNINVSIHQFLMDEETRKGKIPFTYTNYKFSSGTLVFNANEFYKLTVNQLTADQNSWNLEQFSMQPLLSRQEFNKKIPTEKDWYNIKVAKTKISGIDFKISNNLPNVNINQIDCKGINAIIYRSKFPKDDLSRKKMYSELLRSIKFPLLVHNLNVTNSYLQYEEDNVNDNQAGKLIFSDFNLNARNLNSNKGYKNTLVSIAINCQLMKTSPMNVKWSFDPSRNDDSFKISGNVSDLPTSQINLFLKPYLNVSVEGYIHRLNFDFNGNNAQIAGNMYLNHQNLRVSILDENTKTKKKLLSAVVNLFLKTDSDKHAQSVEITAKRDITKSFFNLFWKGIEDGLKKALVSKNIVKKEQKIKKTIENVKEIKKDAKVLKQEIKKAF